MVGQSLVVVSTGMNRPDLDIHDLARVWSWLYHKGGSRLGRAPKERVEADCMIVTRARYGDQEGREAYVFHNFEGIGKGSMQWDTAVEVHIKVTMMFTVMTGFASGYGVNQEPVRVKKEIIQIE